jgi:hypothetical protein
MPRTKKPVEIYSKTGLPFRPDMELVINAQKGDEKSYVELWDKFFLLRQKEKFEFINWCKQHHIENAVYQDYVDSWDADAWEKFRNQMPGIRIDELKEKGYTNDNWGITIRLKGYFDVVNRSYSNNILKKLNNEVPNVRFYDKDDDEGVSVLDNISRDEDILKGYAKKILKTSYSRMLADLNMKQRQVVTLKEKDSSVSAIVRELGIKRKEATDALEYAKTRLEYWVEKSSKEEGVPMTYRDMVEYF